MVVNIVLVISLETSQELYTVFAVLDGIGPDASGVDCLLLEAATHEKPLQVLELT